MYLLQYKYTSSLFSNVASALSHCWQT